MTVQVVIAFLVRPPPDSKFRKYWNMGHYWWGRFILVVSLGNFFFGLWMLHSTPLFYIVPTAILLFWCFVGIVKVCSLSLCSNASEPQPPSHLLRRFHIPMLL